MTPFANTQASKTLHHQDKPATDIATTTDSHHKSLQKRWTLEGLHLTLTTVVFFLSYAQYLHIIKVENRMKEIEDVLQAVRAREVEVDSFHSSDRKLYMPSG